ncbi:tapasin-related protein [Aplochiton taeniatus]
MGFILQILVYLCLFTDRSFEQVAWLSCTFTDEHSRVNDENHTETKFFPRTAVLQLGRAGDHPIHPTITFLLTASKVGLWRYVEEAGADQLQCEVKRYSTEGIQVRWPGQGGTEFDRWFTCTLKHTEGLFVVTGFLRHTPIAPPPVQEDYRSQMTIGDTDTITTSAAMVLVTRSPSVRPGLLSEQKLDCHYTVDHKGANVDVEWRLQRRGERTVLFSYDSSTGKYQGKGVGLKALVGEGDASLHLPAVKMSSEGVYMCSVSTPPLQASQDVTLQLVESPRVSLNVDSSVSMAMGSDQKVLCEAAGYYPLDVEMEWIRTAPGGSTEYRPGAPLPERVQNILFSSHRHNQDGTYSVSAFFYLQGALQDSGYQFTCRVSHTSLRMPIRKTFTLTVYEPSSWTSILTVVTCVAMVAMICWLLRRCLNGRRQANRAQLDSHIHAELDLCEL